jgi:hypothetical protein
VNYFVKSGRLPHVELADGTQQFSNIGLLVTPLTRQWEPQVVRWAEWWE